MPRAKEIRWLMIGAPCLLTRSPAEKGSIGGVIMDFSLALSFLARRPMTTVYKIPRSVLVVIHTSDLQVLMMDRAGWQGFWQSVTGSLAHESEPLRDAAIREVREDRKSTRLNSSH